MFYSIIIPPSPENPPPEELIFEDIKQASQALKRYKGARMKTFPTREKALDFNPLQDESFMEDPSFKEDSSFKENSSIKDDSSFSELSESLEKLTIAGPGTEEFPSVKPGQLNQLRRTIESGDYDKVEEMIWSNPKFLVTVCDSAVYLMAGPKYNAAHIAARANKPDIMALILDTISNISFMRKLYPNEPDTNIQDRINHLLDSYLNTPDPRQGNTPLHFACKLGHYRVVRVLLTFEGCDLNLKDSTGRTAEEGICDDQEETKKRIKEMFKSQLHLPTHRDQLKKKLLLVKRRSQTGDSPNKSSPSSSPVAVAVATTASSSPPPPPPADQMASQ